MIRAGEGVLAIEDLGHILRSFVDDERHGKSTATLPRREWL